MYSETSYENYASSIAAVPLPLNRIHTNENQLATESGAHVPEQKRSRSELNEKIDPKKSETMSSNSSITVNWHRPQISAQETESIDTSQTKTLNRKIPRGAIGLAGLVMHPILPNEPSAEIRPFDQQEATSMITLSSVLTTKSAFFQVEPIIDNYQRKDPKTIVYPNSKPVMPEITINPMNILRRYANT